VRRLGRRGLTLVELVVALAAFAIIAAGVYRALLTEQQSFAAQTQRIGLQENLRAAAAILPAELRGLDAPDGDILAMTATAITLRAMRRLAFLCAAPELGAPGDVTLTLRRAPFFGDRPSFEDGDSLLVYREGDPQLRTDDQWVRGAVVSSAAATCEDGTAGWAVVVSPHWTATATNTPGTITGGSPVRGYVVVTYKLWRSPSDGLWYLAQQQSSATSQPLLGPLSGADGLTFTYFDSTGTTPATTPAQVALIGVTLRGRTARPIRRAHDRGPAYRYDSVSLSVALRNNPRCGAGSRPPRSC
jgi:prepilin-type N-terminal cleavage/methylation domain-containing protein